MKRNYIYGITIYLSVQGKIEGFQAKANYISDLYYDLLDGYRPPKTRRICIHLFEMNLPWQQPWNDGSLHTFNAIFDKNKYLILNEYQKKEYILDILHRTILKMADFFGWDIAIFEAVKEKIIASDFHFYKLYPEKRSPDRKNTGRIILSKTEEISTLKIRILEQQSVIEEILLEWPNWFSQDESYEMAAKAKWFNSDRFGISRNGNLNFYSLSEKVIVKQIIVPVFSKLK